MRRGGRRSTTGRRRRASPTTSRGRRPPPCGTGSAAAATWAMENKTLIAPIRLDVRNLAVPALGTTHRLNGKPFEKTVSTRVCSADQGRAIGRDLHRLGRQPATVGRGILPHSRKIGHLGPIATSRRHITTLLRLAIPPHLRQNQGRGRPALLRIVVTRSSCRRRVRPGTINPLGGGNAIPILLPPPQSHPAPSRKILSFPAMIPSTETLLKRESCSSCGTSLENRPPKPRPRRPRPGMKIRRLGANPLQQRLGWNHLR